REYYADHFAAEVTGNPNGLSRALIKIAYGITEQSAQNQQPSRLMEGTRALGIADPRGAASAGTIYQITSDSQRLGQVFIWDLFNPWAKLTELNSTHPLTGKRIQALSTYAEQMGINLQFNMANVVKEGNKLNKNKLWSNFFLELFVVNSHLIGGILGLFLGILLTASTTNISPLVSFPAMGFGIGLIIKTGFVYPDFKKCPESDIFTLMCDPYGSPVRGKPVKLSGQLIGRGEAGYAFGSDLKLQDRTGMIFARYASRFGPLGNFFFGATQAQDLIGTSVGTMGWFRRGVAPWFDLIQLSNGRKTVNSYHRFSSVFMGSIIILLGMFLPQLIH
ncbi:MAG: M48 family metalloprotease, partial [Cyanobacteria bacterium P01_G01_bin.49]